MVSLARLLFAVLFLLEEPSGSSDVLHVVLLAGVPVVILAVAAAAVAWWRSAHR